MVSVVEIRQGVGVLLCACAISVVIACVIFLRLRPGLAGGVGPDTDARHKGQSYASSRPFSCLLQQHSIDHESVCCFTIHII